MDVWQTILLTFGGNAALLAVLAYLSKSLFEKVIARDTKKFEYELKAKTDTAIEQLRSELQQKAMEHQIRFSRLHEKSLETIAETYALLRQYHISVADYVKIFEPVGEKSKAERRETVNTALINFRDYFGPRQIFLPKETAIKVSGIDRKLFTTANEFAIKVEREHQGDSTEDWIKAFKSVNDEIPLVLELLEDEFRRILGQICPT